MENTKINMEHSYKGHRETNAKIVEEGRKSFWRIAVSGDGTEEVRCL